MERSLSSIAGEQKEVDDPYSKLGGGRLRDGSGGRRPAWPVAHRPGQQSTSRARQAGSCSHHQVSYLESYVVESVTFAFLKRAHPALRNPPARIRGSMARRRRNRGDYRLAALLAVAVADPFIYFIVLLYLSNSSVLRFTAVMPQPS